MFPGFVVGWENLIWADAIAKDVIEAGEALCYEIRRVD
jgi:hypothetical protein